MSVLKTKQNGKWIRVGVGAQGSPGKDGHTPAKGVDYWTDTDKKEVVDEVLSNFVDVSKEGQ